MVDVDDSTRVYKIGGVSKKVRYNDFWANYSDRYVAIALSEKIMAKLDSELYPSDVEVCLRVKPGTSKDFAERLMKLSANQLSVGNLFILKVHDYEDLRDGFQQGSTDTSLDDGLFIAQYSAGYCRHILVSYAAPSCRVCTSYSSRVQPDAALATFK